MCGIVGVFGTLSVVHEKVFSDLLQIDVIRGSHSTGIGYVKTNGQLGFYKNATLPQDLLETEDAMKIFRGVNRCLIGHNRSATKGEVTAKNAHPFLVNKRLLGVHNGTLWSYKHLHGGDKFDVDSEAIYHHMAHKSVEDLWGNLDGSAALVWYDANDKTLNFLRNNQRSLCFTLTPDSKTMIFASEKWMIEGICHRRKVTIGKVWQPKGNNHFKFIFDGTKIEEDVVEYEPYKRPTAGFRRIVHHGGAGVNSPNYYRNMYENYGPGYWGGWDDDDDVLTLPAPEDDENLAAEIDAELVEPQKEQGGLDFCEAGEDGDQCTEPKKDYTPSLAEMQKKDISESKFKKQYKECTFCQTPLASQYEESVILDKHNACCESCAMVADANGTNLMGALS